MASTPDVPEYEANPVVHEEPYWSNSPRTCRYFSEVGIELGHIQLGEGSARTFWFSYVSGDDKPIYPGGRTDREEAKSDVVRSAEINVVLLMAEQEYQDERRRRR